MAHYEIPQIHSYEEYEAFWEKAKQTPEYHHEWDIEFEWNLKIEDADDPRVREIFHSNVIILDVFKKYYKQRVRTVTRLHLDDTVYILDSIQITNEDFYYMLHPEGKDNITKYITCCDRIVAA